MKSNKGFSLVELLVTIAVAGIVSAAIISLMMQSINIYNRETVNAKLQMDLQTASNYLFDDIMQSKGFVIKNNGTTSTKFALLGDFEENNGSYKIKNGHLYAYSSESIYLFEYSYPEIEGGAGAASLETMVNDINSKFADITKPQNLLVNNVSKCLLEPADGVLQTDAGDPTKNTYKNPISIDVKVCLKKDLTPTKAVEKNINETIDMRNTVKTKVYYDGKEYRLFTTAKLNKIKTDVNSEIMLAKKPGEISIQSGGSAKSGAINILEIIPDESYDYIQYIIGGKNGECIIGTPEENGTSYGGTVSNLDFEAYMSLEAGDYGDGKNGNGVNSSNMSAYFPNDMGPDLQAIVFADLYLDGYYEYVGENKGIYAINSIEEVTGALKLIDSDDGSGEYYIPTEVSDGKLDYNKVVEDYYPDPSNPYWHYERTYYEYVGDGNGNVNLEFNKQGWYSGGNSYRPIDSDSNLVKNLIMYSKCNSETPSYSQDYGFVWHESSHDNKTKASDVKRGFNIGDRIYLKNHRRWKIINNDLFRLFVMQNLMEKCLPSGYSKLDITKGVWDTEANTYCTPNYEAVVNWNKITENVIELNPKAGNNVTVEDVENADLIIVGCGGDGGFDFAHNTYCKINKISSNSVEFNSSNDISFDVAKAIYKRVLNENAAIACQVQGVVDPNAKLNISKMAFMLYGIRDYTVNLGNASEVLDSEKISKESTGKDYWSDDIGYQSNMPFTVNGSGRTMYKDYIDSMPANDIDELNKYFYLVSNGADFNGQRNNEDSQIQVEGTFTKIDPHCFIYGKKYSDDHSFKYTYCGVGINKAKDSTNSAYGIYRNQLMWERTSSLLHFYKSGSAGLLGLQSIFKATQDEDSVDIPIGNIYVEGACATGHERTFAKYIDEDHPRGTANSEDYYEANAVTYESKAVIINKGEADERAIIYLNEQEYEVAKSQGLDIYCVVKSKDACTDEDTYVYQNESNIQKASAHQDYKNGTLTNETHIREFKYNLTADDLAGITVGSKKDYVAYAKISSTEGDADGDAKFSIVVRDLFNLN